MSVPFTETALNVVVAATTGRSAVVGDRARVRALVAWAQQVGLAHTRIAALDTDRVRLSPVDAAALADELAEAGYVLREGVKAIGWVTQGRDGLAGGWFPLEAPTVLVATDDGDLVAGPGPRLAWRGTSGTVSIDQWDEDHPQAPVLARLARQGTVRPVDAVVVVAPLVTTLVDLARTAALTHEHLAITGAGNP